MKIHVYTVEGVLLLSSLVPRPLIQRVYRLQYNARILKAIRAGVGLGLGPRLVVVLKI